MKIVKSILLLTLCFELVGAILSFLVFSQDYPLGKAIGISLFHSISSFNNAGFDILGEFRSMIPYQNNVLLNLTTCGLIIFGGLGFFVIKEIISKKKFKKFSLHSKVVLTMTAVLLVIGTILIKLTEDITWLGAFFQSTAARTAGFSTYPIGTLSNASLFVIMILMFIGASPGSTGGGVKTTTAFIWIKSAYSVSVNKHCMAFKRKIPNEVIMKAFVITALSSFLIITDTLILTIIQPQYTFEQLLFEVISAFGTVGLSTGITPDLNGLSRVAIILTMFTGRLGAMTMASIWINKQISNVSYTEENITIG